MIDRMLVVIRSAQCEVLLQLCVCCFCVATDIPFLFKKLHVFLLLQQHSLD